MAERASTSEQESINKGAKNAQIWHSWPGIGSFLSQIDVRKRESNCDINFVTSAPSIRGAAICNMIFVSTTQVSTVQLP